MGCWRWRKVKVTRSQVYKELVLTIYHWEIYRTSIFTQFAAWRACGARAQHKAAPTQRQPAAAQKQHPTRLRRVTHLPTQHQLLVHTSHPRFFFIFLFNAMPRHCNVNCTCCGGHRRRTSRLRTAYGGPQTPDAAWHACGRAEATSTARAAPTHAALCTRVHLFFFTHDAPAAPLGAALRVYVPPTVARNHPSQHRRVTRQRRVGAAWGRADATSTPRAYFAPAFFFSNATQLCPVTRLP